jgi:ribonuclease HI
MIKKLYTDAGYTWQNTATTKDGEPIMGRICVADEEGFNSIEMAGVGKVPVLKQYINVFELIAIARAIEVAIEKGWVGSLSIHTDSKVAMIWASTGKVSSKVETDAHIGALEYLRTARKNYIGIVTYNHVGREHNPAGKLLEKELEKDRAKRMAQAQSESPEPINRGDITLDPLADVDV